MLKSITIILSLSTIFIMTGCQTSAISSSHQPTSTIAIQQQLNQAIKNTLYQRQNWIAEQQIYLNNIELKKTAKLNSLEKMTECQLQHDNILIAQMKKDNILEYAKISELTESQQLIYSNIRNNYLTCYQQANTAYKENNPETTAQTNLNDINYFADMLTGIGLSEKQINSINHFISKSGKVIVTGNYLPDKGQIALQLDAGFENKNLKYHYRLPIVINWKKQATYIKPDIFMPLTAIYLDNQLGMSWQHQWYKFNHKNNQIPVNLTSEAWINAIKESFTTLPASQFNQVNAKVITANISNSNQSLIENANIIHWQQNTKEQNNLYQDIVNRFILNMDGIIEQKQFKEYQRAWNEYKQKLSHHLEQQLISSSNHSNRSTGHEVYFIINNQQVQQIYAKNTANLLGQPIQINTWLTMNPQTDIIAHANQPKTLQKMVNDIRDDNSIHANVIDGRRELKRIKELDNSRRLFGVESEWIKLYDDYKNMAEQKHQKTYCSTLKENIIEANCWNIQLDVIDSDSINKQCQFNADYQDYMKHCNQDKNE